MAKVLPLVRNLIERLRATLRANADGDDHQHLFVGDLGALAINGNDTPYYRNCRDALVALHGNAADRRLISRRSVEKLLTETLMRTLRPARAGYNDPRPRFERRMRGELRRLRDALMVPIRAWQIAVEVAGFAHSVLPMTLGRIRFVRGTTKLGAKIASNVFDLQPGDSRLGLKRTHAENAVRQKSREEVTEMFSRNAVALADVGAVDSAAAKALGLAEVRLTIDVLNYFAPFFEHPIGPHLAHVAPESRGANLRSVVHDPKTRAFSYNDEAPDEWLVRAFKPTSRVARRIGVVRIHQLLGSVTRSDLEDRIVTAASWAGRARAATRREEAFLLYAIALEALFTKPNARSGVTERLKLRVAHVVHFKPRKLDGRRILAATMDRLYQIRSGLVHAGTADELGDQELKVIERVVELALWAMLTQPPFLQMRSAAAFEKWFEDRLLGGR